MLNTSNSGLLTYKEFFNIRSKIAKVDIRLNTNELKTFSTAMNYYENCRVFNKYLSASIREIEKKYLT